MRFADSGEVGGGSPAEKVPTAALRLTPAVVFASSRKTRTYRSDDRGLNSE